MKKNMFISARRSVIAAAIILLNIFNSGIYGQDPKRIFEQGDYRSALEGFKAQKEEQPGNPLYSYYAGRCLVELNEDLDVAIEWLYGAAKGQVPADVDFYLGKAYHRNYNFQEAIRYYGKYELGASKQEVKEMQVKHLIRTCRSALGITSTYNQYEVMAVTFIDLTDSVQYSQIRMKGGQLQRKPMEYTRVDEDREALSNLMFMPPNPIRGDFAFFSGYDRSGKNGAQIFRIRKGTVKAWGDPVEIKSLNTEGDEILPYFDPIENDLYFSSNGRDGVGGFDLYRSHYDSERDKWTEPLNLGFPVNSVMDEYLVLPGSDLGMLMFFSTRQGTDSTTTVYRVHLVEPKMTTNGNNPALLREVASLGNAASEILAEIETISKPEKNKREMPARSQDPEITKVTILSAEREPVSEEPVYQKTLALALMHQATSDSLKDLATAARLKVRESADPNDRWVWQKQIMVWEKKARDEEELADVMYTRMEVEKNVEGAGRKPVVNVPEAIEVDTVMEDLTVYRYKTESQPAKDQLAENQLAEGRSVKGEPGTPPVSVNPAANGRINRFDILTNSPYDESHPIPVDVPIPGGVYYRIQLGAFGQPVTQDNFQGISPITAETIPERGLIKYYAGKFSKYNDASLALVRIRSAGYEDAFIVAWYNGNTVPTQKAKQLE